MKMKHALPLLLLAVSLEAVRALTWGDITYTLFQGVPNMCGMPFEDTYRRCVAIRKPCGGFEAGAANLTVVGTNTEGRCLVANFTDLKHGLEVCDKSHLEMVQPDGCISWAIMPKKGEFVLAVTGFLLVEAALVMFVLQSWGRPPRDLKLPMGLLYWYNDFWAGLYAWEVAAFYLSTGLKDGWARTLLGFFAAMCIETVFYDVPMMMQKPRPDHFVYYSAIFGVCWGWQGISMAYQLDAIAILGPHIIRMGVYQFAVDIVKGSLKQLGLRMLSSSAVKTPYEPLVTELTSPLPLDP